MLLGQGRPNATGGLAPWQVELVAGLLLNQLSRGLPVAELARRCGLSRSHFTRAFKASVGLPPHRWLMLFRIARARDRLETSADSIADIAFDCGFADQSHLTRVFHDVIGVSPAAWRRRARACPAP